MDAQNYYEFLQISPKAEPDTIHRVYKFLAARYHPDNGETGDAGKFYLLKQAYDVLSDPEKRAKYDSGFETEPAQPDPLSTSVDFMDKIDGELNRRWAFLALLYIQRRTNPSSPEVPLKEVELRMGFPRDYLEFTTWYLLKKGFITRGDNSAFTLTAEGVDFVETHRGDIPVLNKLLTTSTETAGKVSARAANDSASPQEPIIVPHTEAPLSDRRSNSGDRRAHSQDRRSNSPDRRSH
jgi:curved DNA-binding protein CbpA